MDHVGNALDTPYTFTAPSDWPQELGRTDTYAPKSLQSNSQRPDKINKHQVPVFPPPSALQPQRMSLEKYKEKHAAELAAQKRKQEQPGSEPDLRDWSTSSGQVEHQKLCQPYVQGQQSSSSSTPIGSPLKMKLPFPGQEKSMGEKREKSSLVKVRLPVMSQAETSGSKEELKMKIKVSSERHNSSDESSTKSKHSSPLISKEKHSFHRHHQKHAHSNPYVHSGNGSALKSPKIPPGEVPSTVQISNSSRKRTHVEASHNHSRKSKSSKSGTGSSSFSSVQQCII